MGEPRVAPEPARCGHDGHAAAPASVMVESYVITAGYSGLMARFNADGRLIEWTGWIKRATVFATRDEGMAAIRSICAAEIEHAVRSGRAVRELDEATGEVVVMDYGGRVARPLRTPAIKFARGWRGRYGGYQNHCSMLRYAFKPLFEEMAARHDADPGGHPFPPLVFNWHALRHFAISTWIEAGLSPKTVQTFAGHSGLEMTMDRYGHMFPSEDHREVMDRLAFTLRADGRD